MKKLTAIAIFGLLSVLTTPGIASAAPGDFWVEGSGFTYSAPSGCRTGALCIYDGKNFKNLLSQFKGNNRSWSPYAAYLDDTSAYNNGTSGLDAAVFRQLSPNVSMLNYCLARGKGWKSKIANSKFNNSGQANEWEDYC